MPKWRQHGEHESVYGVLQRAERSSAVHTMAKKPFKVEVIPQNQSLWFEVLFTGKLRKHELRYIERVHKCFEETQSFRPGDYSDHQ